MATQLKTLTDGEYGPDVQEKYAGEWIAMLDGKIFAANKDLTIVMQEIEKLKLPSLPLVTKVLRPDEEMCVL